MRGYVKAHFALHARCSTSLVLAPVFLIIPDQSRVEMIKNVDILPIMIPMIQYIDTISMSAKYQPDRISDADVVQKISLQDTQSIQQCPII